MLFREELEAVEQATKKGGRRRKDAGQSIVEQVDLFLNNGYSEPDDLAKG
jgi:hypothetical protein